MSRASRVLTYAVAMLGLPAGARAGGPLVFTTGGDPVGWSTAAPVSYYTDQGGLGLLDNAAAVARVQALFTTWQDIPTAAIDFARGGSTAVDVDETNFVPFLGPFGGATSPLGQSVIVFDQDGAIFDTLFGVGSGVLGFAAVTFLSDGVTTVPIGDPVPPGAMIIEALAFLNGKWIDGVDDFRRANFELSGELFDTVFVHEFGHFSGLDHTQIHGLGLPPEADSIGFTQPVETLFPFLTDVGQLTPGRDDVVALSVLYPAPGFGAATGRITGRVLTSDGTPLSGINVIARNVADDSDAVSYVSGATLTPVGTYVLAGLTPGESYRVAVQQIDAFANGGSGVGPFSPPVVMPGPPEFYNGASEGAGPDDGPADATPVVVSPGGTVANVDITLNHQSFRVANAALDVGSFVQGFAIGDFDGDTVADFVATQFGFTPGNLTRFHRGLGGGSFAAPIVIDAFPGNERVVAGQFNRGVDAFLDIAVASSSLQEVRLYFGAGDGSFGPPASVLNLPDEDFSRLLIDLLAGDLNGDAFADLFTMMFDPASGDATAYALLGSATGSFAPMATPLALGSGVPLGRLVLAPIAGSAANDVIGVANSVPGQFGLLIGDGAGGFAPTTVSIPTISHVLAGFGFAAGDFDENGTTDLVISNLHPFAGPTNFTRAFIDVLAGDGAGAFMLSDRYFVSEVFQEGIVVADLDGDGHLDIASAGADLRPRRPGAKAMLAFGDGSGHVGRITTIWGLAEFPGELAAADLDGDSRLDLLINDSRIAGLGVDAVPYYSVLLQVPCGDGVLDGPEECDDGNQVSGDGCDANCALTGCGNGIVTAGEQCDDGNALDGDCCSTVCQFETAGSPCADDGNLCSSDACNAIGRCVHPAPLRLGCRTAEKSVLRLQDKRFDAGDLLEWKWIRGQTTSVSDFGDPRATTDYALCLYAGSTAAFISAVQVRADATNWSLLGGKGFQYHRPRGDLEGVHRVVLKASDEDRAKAVLKGKGVNLPQPILGNLPMPVTAQLINSDNAVCWETVHDSVDVVRNAAGQFKAKESSP